MLLVGACSEVLQETEQPAEASSNPASEQAAVPIDRRFPDVQLTMPTATTSADPGEGAKRKALFGDMHVHTDYSFDAYAFGTVATPDDAYRYAQGEGIEHPAGFEVRLKQPLDFYAVTDHGMFLGAVKAAADTDHWLSELPYVQGLHNLNRRANQTLESVPQRTQAFSFFLPMTLGGVADGTIDQTRLNQISIDAWSDIIRSAEAHYRPGEFTTFVAYEYTSSSDDSGNLHRNVIFRDTDKLPVMPFSRFHSQNPEGLWDWMDQLRGQGIESLAIPHNSNGSNGQMFKLEDWAGDPLDDEYAKQRIRNEPLIELTQIKGTSETHPILSDTDEWADFEIMPYRIATTLPSEPKGSYAREALLNGIALQDEGITNPYQFGFIGSSDTHTAAGSYDEETYFSKAGLLDSDGERRGSVPVSAGTAEIIRSAGRAVVKDIEGRSYIVADYETWGASGLTGVWADENDRESIYAALRRKETFATSGPRLQVRLFAGYELDDQAAHAGDWRDAYSEGVPMGAELSAQPDGAPTFVAWASRDANSAPLQRLQIIKGWVVNGEHHERVYDVACSDGGEVDPETHRCPDNGARVNLADCSITGDVGASELTSVWHDPEFEPSHRAFYCVRVLENPTCRWSTWDAVRAGVAPREDLAKTLQERAWSSPIWIFPGV